MIKSNKDINIDVTPIVRSWYSGSVANNGFIIKQAVEFVNNLLYNINLDYFSLTHLMVLDVCQGDDMNVFYPIVGVLLPVSISRDKTHIQRYLILLLFYLGPYVVTFISVVFEQL